ncbi:hypothetical protein GALMADRAFT_234278 [Galerina marginata CBS 339.88]|uniref:VHS domain-containing protein n=1 Tax=Galerina marginata (strain CBS 339.88) TaxID=685588 RepID=A0A067TQG6_GALM3|nr:hypothetical protein GALMADRAFT_234278 [Galerina marginata CBS 339.88]
MSALTFARQAFGREKPHSSITDWVDILTGSGIAEEAYDGIPELVDSIGLQASGPAEASRALRKKLKHGNPHQQYRALVILKALVENCGQKFQNTFADGHMTDALKGISNDSTADRRVRKKLLLVLGSWRDQYKDDPSMAVVAGLYKQCHRDSKRVGQQELADMMGLSLNPEEKKRIEKHEAKMRAKKEKEDRARAEREREHDDRNKKKRVPFDFEKDKPKVLASIVEASQASSNLVNAITLVNLATDSLETNERVQECLAKAKQARKPVVRYIQLVENEEVIGTLIETNDRIVAALEMYEKFAVTGGDDDAGVVTKGMAAVTVTAPESNNPAKISEDATKGKNRNIEQPTHLHPDLEDLNFGPLGHSSANLPPPMRPSTLSDDEQDVADNRGSLSDFSDYESSDEETHKKNAGPSSKRNYVTVSDDEDVESVPFSSGTAKGKTRAENNPFADPFADL